MTDTSVFSQRNYAKLYFGSLFVGHCTSDDVVDHFFEFVRDLRLDLNLLLAFGIDGPIVNKSFESKLPEELQGATHFLDVGTCSIHVANNTFLEMQILISLQ